MIVARIRYLERTFAVDVPFFGYPVSTYTGEPEYASPGKKNSKEICQEEKECAPGIPPLYLGKGDPDYGEWRYERDGDSHSRERVTDILARYGKCTGCSGSEGDEKGNQVRGDPEVISGFE